MAILGPPTLADGDYHIDHGPERYAAPCFPGEDPHWLMTRNRWWEGWLATAKPRRKSRWWKPFRLQTYIEHVHGLAYATSYETDAETGLRIIRFQGTGQLTHVA